MNKKRIFLPDEYNIYLIRKIWQTMKMERNKNSHGRERFASFIYDSIAYSWEEFYVSSESNKSIDILNEFPTAETIDNFLKNGLVSQSKTRNEKNLLIANGKLASENIKTSSWRTLSVLYTFCHVLNFDRAASWNIDFYAESDYLEHIDRLTYFFQPTDCLQRPIILLLNESEKEERYNGKNIYNDTNKKILEMTVEAIIYFNKIGNNSRSIPYYIDRISQSHNDIDFYEHREITQNKLSNSDDDVFSPISNFQPIGSLAFFQIEGYVRPSVDKPTVKDSNIFVSSKIFSYVRKKFEYFTLEIDISQLDLVEQTRRFKQLILSDLPTATVCFNGEKKEYKAYYGDDDLRKKFDIVTKFIG